MAVLTLVRHASTAAGADRRYQGALDPPLSPDGVVEARALAVLLADRAFDAVWSSDLRRAVETATIAFPGCAVRIDRRLRELDFGAFEGRTHEVNLRERGAAYRRWIADPAAAPPPGGEPLGALEARINAWLAALPAEGTVVAVAHGGSIRAAVAAARGEPFAAVRALDVPPCGIVEVGPVGSRP